MTQINNLIANRCWLSSDCWWRSEKIKYTPIQCKEKENITKFSWLANYCNHVYSCYPRWLPISEFACGFSEYSAKNRKLLAYQKLNNSGTHTLIHSQIKFIYNFILFWNRRTDLKLNLFEEQKEIQDKFTD